MVLGCVGTVPMRYIAKINDLYGVKNKRVLLFNKNALHRPDTRKNFAVLGNKLQKTTS
jgi:hypothetical protein